MIKLYFKQAIEMLKQNTFFSIISILGTALAIMMIMAILVSDEVKNINIAPEINRDRTLYMSFETKKDTVQGSSWAGSISYDVFKNYISLLETPELISGQTKKNTQVGMEGSSETIPATIMLTDVAFWKILKFTFLEGKPFGEEEFQSGIRDAVLSERVARKLFKGEKAIGQTIRITHQHYRVVGIVQDVSPVFKMAAADIWIPYTSTKISGVQDVMLLVKDPKDITVIQNEIKKLERKYQDTEAPMQLSLRGPETHKVHEMGLWGNTNEEMNENVKIRNRKIGFILIIILLVPAINLSGLNLSRIKKRTPEIGVRKAFGAKRHIILIQVLCENLITSFIGGIIGLLLSYLVIFQMRDWLLGIPSDSMIPMSTLISVPVLVAVFIVCILVNILSAAIPAYRASRMKIIHSLTNNEK